MESVNFAYCTPRDPKCWAFVFTVFITLIFIIVSIVGLFGFFPGVDRYAFMSLLTLIAGVWVPQPKVSSSKSNVVLAKTRAETSNYGTRDT